MKTFRFTLEKVLRVRQHQSMLAKHAVAQAQLLAGKAWVALEQARLARTQFETEWEERRKNRMTARQWSAYSEQHQRLAQTEQAAASELHSALAEVSRKRDELEAAMQREKALDKLREQQYEAYQQEQLAVEQAQNDEIAQTRRGE